MEKLIKSLGILILCMLVGTFVACNYYLNGVDPIVADELDRLAVQPIDDAVVSQLQLPDDLDAGADFGLKASICSQGGYDLYPYAGQTLTSTSVAIKGNCSDLPIEIWVLSTDEVVACAYLTVTGNSSVAPGVWAVSDASCTIKSPTSGCERWTPSNNRRENEHP